MLTFQQQFIKNKQKLHFDPNVLFFCNGGHILLPTVIINIILKVDTLRIVIVTKFHKISSAVSEKIFVKVHGQQIMDAK